MSISNLSLQSYATIFTVMICISPAIAPYMDRKIIRTYSNQYSCLQALCRNSGKPGIVGEVPHLEEGCFKSQDLKSVLGLVGLTDGSRKKKVWRRQYLKFKNP